MQIGEVAGKPGAVYSRAYQAYEMVCSFVWRPTVRYMSADSLQGNYVAGGLR